ncbi:MAG: MOSC domain-containing protein [Myxococcota bacterium]
MSELRRLMKVHAQAGTVEWIGLSPGRREPIQVVQSAEVRPKTGLVGDRHANGGRSKRQVTLIQAEHLGVIAGLIGREVHPEQLRRNVVVRGINLYALRQARFRVGDVVLEGTGTCDPCRRMEENLGEGGFSACRGHGGITAIVHEGGTIAIGDAVVLIEDPGLLDGSMEDD